MGSGRRKVAGAGYVVLNVIRAMNITSLLAVIAASLLMLVRMFNTKQFFFFDAMENLIRSVISGFLILTETPLFKSYFTTHWPLFSPSHGFTMLGTAMLLLGNSILANLNKPAASVDNIGISFWRLIIASGIVVFVMGAINILASFIFRDTTMQLTARQVRSNGAVAGHKLEVESQISTPKVDRRSRYKSFFFRQKDVKHDSLPSYQSKTYMTQVTSPRPAIPAVPTQYQDQVQTPQRQQEYTNQGHVRMPSVKRADCNPYTNEKYAISPAASSKYSVSSRLGNGEPVTRPDMAHHPALNRGQAF